MEITFAPKGILQINGAIITHRNFAGEANDYNREGDRNFSMVIPNEETYERLKADGWPVKYREPKEEGDTPFMFLPVKIKFNDFGPTVILVSGENRFQLDENTVQRLDRIDILNVDLDIRPYDWTWNKKSGRTAYLQGMEVTQKLDRFAARFATTDEM